MLGKTPVKKRLPNWFVAALDQMSFSLITFLTTMILSRLMSIESFSEFSIAFAVFLFGALLHQSMVIDPMLMAAKKSQRIFYHFFLVSAGGALIFSTVSVIALAIFLKQKPSLAFFVFSFLMLNLYFVRRALIVMERLYISAFVGFLTLVFQTVLLLVFGGLISDRSDLTFYLLAFPSLFSILLMLGWLGERFKFDQRMLKACFYQAVGFGRWIGLSSFVAWPITNIYYFILPVYIGLASVSEFKLLFTIMMPATQLVTALCVFCLPRLSRLKSDKVGFVSFFRRVCLFSLLASVLYSLVSSVLVVGFSGSIWSGVYEFSPLDLMVASLFMLMMNFVSVSLLLLKSIGMTKVILKGNALVLMATLLTANGLVYYCGVTGAFLSLSMSFLALGLYFFRCSGVGFKAHEG